MNLDPKLLGRKARLTALPISAKALAATSAMVIALACAAVGTAFAQPMPGGPGGGPGACMHGMHGGGMGMGMFGHGRMLDQVGASAEQKTKIHEIFKAAHDDLRGQRQAAQPMRDEMVKLLAAPVVDAAAVEVLRQKIETQRDAHSKRMTRAMIDASAVLTPEQRQKVAERMAQQRSLMERHQREREALDGSPKR